MINDKLHNFNALKSKATALIKTKLGKGFTLQHYVPSKFAERVWSVVVEKLNGKDYTAQRTFQTVKNAGLYKKYNVVEDYDQTYLNATAALQELIDALNAIDDSEVKPLMVTINRSVQRTARVLKQAEA